MTGRSRLHGTIRTRMKRVALTPSRSCGASLQHGMQATNSRSSSTLRRQEKASAGSIFSPEARGAWAPDISYFNGRYHLYYALSTFGSRNSAIGLATSPTLDPADPKYAWTDEGMVLRSFQDKDDWNAIDPNLALGGA